MLFFLFLNTFPYLPVFSGHRDHILFEMSTLEMRDSRWAVRAGLRIPRAFLELARLFCLPVEGQSHHTSPQVTDMGFYIASGLSHSSWRVYWSTATHLLLSCWHICSEDVAWRWVLCDELPLMSTGESTAFQDAQHKHRAKVSTVSIAAAEVGLK